MNAKRWIARFMILGAIPAFLSGCIGLGGPSDAPVTGTVSGKVTARDGNAPLIGVFLKTRPETMVVTTDGNGDFTFTDLAANPYTIVATRSGYRDAMATVSPSPGQWTLANLQLDAVKPVLSVTPGSLLDFSVNGTVLQLAVTNASGSGAALTYTLHTPVDASWLHLSKSGGQVADTPDLVLCTVTRADLIPGNYSTLLTVASNGGTETITVGMIVANPEIPQLSLAESQIDFDSMRTSARIPLLNSGKASLQYNIQSDMGWLTLSPKSGSINVAPALIDISVTRTGIPIGAYKGQITITFNGGSSTIGVRMTVASPAMPGTEHEAESDWTLTLSTSQFGYKLSDIHSVDDDHAWTCGRNGTTGLILKYNPTMRAWEKEALPAGIQNVGGIHMLSANQGYANAVGTIGGGQALIILRYDGLAWESYRTHPIPFSPTPLDVHALSDTAIFTTYTSGRDYVYCITPQGWTDQGIEGKWLAFRDAREGYVCGATKSSWKFNGHGWSLWESEPAAKHVSISKTGNLYALMYGSPLDSLLLFGTGGRRLKSIPLTASNYTIDSHAITAFDDTHVWITGDSGSLLFYDGTNLRETRLTAARGLFRMAFHNAASGWALADNGIHLYR